MDWLEKSKDRPELTIFQRISRIFWRSIFVGVVYTLTTFFLGTLLTRQGIPFPDLNKLGVNRMWFLVASIVMGFVMGAVSQIVHTSKANHILTWTIFLFLNPFAVTLESALLAPNLLNVTALPSVMIVQFLAALVTALLITFLFASSSKQIFGSYIHRSWSAWFRRIGISIILSFLIFVVFSATNYQLVKKLYFDNYQIALDIPVFPVILTIQFMKAFLIVLSLIPMITTIGATKRFIAVMSGISLVVLGALGPFLQVSNLSMFLLLASSGKIFIQNFLIGVLVGFILGCPSKLEESETGMINYIRPKLRKGLSNTAEFFAKPFQPSEDKPPEQTKTSEEAPKESAQTPSEDSKDNSDKNDENSDPKEKPAENPQEVPENSQAVAQEQSAAVTDLADNAPQEQGQTKEANQT